AGEHDVADAGEGLEEAEDPEAVAEPEDRRDDAAEKRPPEAGGEPDGGERDPPVVGAVAHGDQERARERHGEVVCQLVEDDEAENLEAAGTPEYGHQRP